jgi:nucleotide-binding universal stress UspA family protein
MNMQKKILIVILVAIIAGLHYLSSMKHMYMHEFYRELFFIPVILAGFWGGKKAGLTTSVIASLLFLPHAVLAMGHSQSALLTNLFEVVMFNIVGGLVGAFGDVKQNYASSLKIPYNPASVQINKKFLIVIDGTPASLYAAQYLARLVRGGMDSFITILWVFKPKGKDYFESSSEVTAYNSELYLQQKDYLLQAKEVLLEAGVPQNCIATKTATIKNKSAADVIMDEVESGGYEAVVITKHPMTKKEEFIFGSTTIRLVRKAKSNVIAVKVPIEAETAA